MNTELSITQLILDASPVVQGVMLMLLLASLASWALIFSKRRQFSRARKEAAQFEERFWSGGDLAAMYRKLNARGGENHGMEAIFEAGFTEFIRLRKQSDLDPQVVASSAHGAMRVALAREVDNLEGSLAFLASVGSVSPYVGLFGTVWGIMHAFLGLGQVGHATLSTVAPGIAEALIATAMGLFAAIPAVMAYNRYANTLERLAVRYETFLEEFFNILRRQAHA